MKAIFLDIDGVVATPTSVRLNYLLGRDAKRQWYDPVSLAYLGRLVSKTGAVVVLASNWRHDRTSSDPHMRAVMDNLFAQLATAGAPVDDATPLVADSDRSGEIGAWLDEHPCTQWVIIDDLARFEARPEVCAGHLVLIANSEGIRALSYRQALSILQQP